MTVDITQDEMNILNLNGISADDVRNNIEFHRASGLDDKAIRQQFTNTINELRPLTKQSATDTAKIKEWQNKGAITPFEHAKRESVEFNGTYNNINKYANLNLTPEQIQKREQEDKLREQRIIETEERLAREKEERHQQFLDKLHTPEKLERNKRVNEGTASFFDRVGSYLDRQAEISERMNYKNNGNTVNYVAIDPVARMAGIDANGNVKNNVDKSKPIGFNESLVNNGIMNGSWIPFIGGFLKDADVKKQREIQEHIIKGEPIRPDELNFLNHRLEKQQEEQVRGYTWGGKVAQGFLPSLIRFGTEMATGGYILKGLGLAAELPQGASIGTKAMFGLKDMAKTGIVNTVTPIGWNDIYENYQDRMLNNEMKFTDKGEWIFKESEEKPATAFMKSLGQTFVMFASEASGQLLGIPVQGISGAASKYVGTPISKYLMNNKTLSEFTKKAIPQFSKLYEKLNGLPIKGQNLDWLKSKVKFDGFFEELGEEVVEDVLNLTIGTNNEERSLENYAKAVFKSPDEWAVLAGAIALQGGTLSVASHVLGSHLERNGASDEQILDVLNSLSENDKEQMVENLIQDGVLNIDATDEEKFEHSVNTVVDSLVESGKFTSREKAEQAARLGATMLQNLSEKTGIDVNELIEKEMADINVSEQEMFVDENGTLHSGVTYNEGEETSPEFSAADKVNEVLNQYVDEFSNLPDDFDDMDYINDVLNKMTILEEITNNNLSLENMEKANDLIAEYRENGENDIADAMTVLMNSETPLPITKRALNQTSEFAGATPTEYKDAKKEWKEKGTESKYFKKWFGDSKVVDENGKPLIVYHGTPNAGFEEFRNNSHFTSNKDYANIYQNQGASSISYKKTANNPQTYSVYLSIKNPFDTRNTDARNIFLNEYQAYYSPDLTDRGMVDWMEVEELTEWLKENHPEYDGIIADEGGTGGYGDEVLSRGVSYIPFSPQQIKSVNNQGTFDSNNANIYLQREINNKNIENNFGMTADEITSIVQADIMNILEENNVDESEFNFEDIRVYGSYSTGKNKATSDIDIMVQYSGTMGEDGAFNMFADEELYISDKDGKQIRVDINPINSAESGTIDEQLDYYDTLEPKSEKQLYQTASNTDEKNLLMTHAAKADRIDDIIQSGVLVAPSMAITKKGENQALKNFGEVLFIRKPEKIDFNEDNIFDRDIYSPRMPKPHFELKNGRVIDSYELDNIYRMDNERAKRAYGVTKEEYLLDAKKVLFMGYTRSGNPIYKPYNSNFLLEYMKKEKLVGGENFDYGLLSLLAKFSTKQNNLATLKETANTELTTSSEELKKQYDDIQEEYKNLAEKIRPYYTQKYVFLLDAMNDIVFDIVKNKKKDLAEYVDIEKLPKETIKEIKDFVKKALKMPRSYFESKPLKKVYLEEFSDALVPENTLTKEQIKELSLYGISVKEYEQGKFEQALENVQQENPRMLFQSAYHGTPHKFEEFSLDAIGTGEGAQAHGWGLYFAGDKNVSENYRKNLSIKPYNKIQDKLWSDLKNDNIPLLKGNIEKELFEYIANNLGDSEFNPKTLKRFFEDLETPQAKEYANILLSELENIGHDSNGQLYKVDIPENDLLLDEDKKFSEQSKKVQNALKELSEEYNRIEDFAIKYDMTGKEIYKMLSEDAGSNQDASYELNDVGIKGISYDGKSDGKCYVVFDDKAIKVLKRYYQKRKAQKAKQEKLFIDNEKAREISNRVEKVKGSFIPAENLINLFKDADESTIVHEFAHWWLEKLVKYAGENEEVQQDLEEIRKFVKNNGEPFTDGQHEKFARGFETYMRTGSAKTNRLKRLFEDFKNALLSLYDSIKELGFEEEEIPEIHKLFDRLLTTENQRVKAAVFDRVNEIQTQIETIKEKQNSEIAYIDEIYNNNLEREAFDRKRENQVQEYLILADKAVNRIPQSVKDYAKRCRTACYEILAAALNGKYSIQYIQMTLGQNNKKAENLREQLLEVSDGITTSGGMRGSWYEFFGDTGVNYDTDEIDGDYKLVEQALSRVESNNFYPLESETGEEDIGKFFGAFDYLSGKVLSLKGENKDAAYEALTRLFDNRTYGNLVDFNKLPDDAMKEIAQKLEEISSTYIEQKVGEKNLKGFKNVSLQVQLISYLTTKLHEMKSYDPVEKKYVRLSSVNRLYGLLSHVRDTFSAKEVIRQINAHAIKSLENRQRGILNKEIQRQIKTNSKLIKVGALKRGKFDWKTNTVFSELADMNRLSLEDARKEYLRLTHADEVALGEERESVEENPTATLDAPTDFQKVLKTKFLEYKSNKLNDLNVSATRSLLEDIIELKFEGRRAKSEEELKKALTRYNYENNLIEIINNNKYNNKAKYIARWVAGDTWVTSEGTLANWESLLNAVFDRETAKKYSLLKLESDAEVYAHKKLSEFYKKAIDIYNIRRSNVGNWNKFKNFVDKTIDFDDIQPLVNLFNEYDNEVYTYKQATWNKDTLKVYMSDVDITKSQIITFYTWSLNPELKKRLITQFGGDEEKLANGLSLGETMLEDMFSKLSDADKNFAWLLVDTCESMYPDTNDVFIRTTGLSLQRVDNYFPSKTERVGSDIDMLHEFVVRSTNPSFIKSRKSCGRIKMDAQNPLEILLPHVNKTARYVVLSERVNFLNRIFATNDIQAALIGSFGKESGKKIHQVILNQLATSTYTNYARSITVGKSLMDKIASNYITSRIGGNLKVMFSQLTSVINYTENMPVSVWAKGFADAIKNPKETIKFMFDNCQYLSTRLAGNSMNEIMQRLTSETDRFRSLKNFCSTNTKYGDIAAICFGGKPYVDYLISTGLSKEEAFNKFVEDTLRSQQSGHNSATSAWQKKQADNAVTRMIFAFNNTNLQYERKWVDAISNYVKGETTKKEFAKAFLIYKVFNPILFTSFLTNLSVASLIRAMFGGGDDDQLLGFGSDVLSSILLSNLKGYGLLGIVANSLGSIVYASLTKGKYLEQELPLISDMEETAQKLLTKDDLSFGDYIQMLSTVGDYSTGVPVTRLGNTVGGAGDIMQGEFGVGALRMMGYGKYKANMAAKGEPPKKK